MGQTKVDNRTDIVGPQVDGELVGFDTLFSLKKLGACSAILVPEGVVQRLFLDSRGEVQLCLSEIALEEHKNTKC